MFESIEAAFDLGRVIAFIGDNSFGLTAVQQEDGLRIFGSLSCGDAEVYRQPGFISQQMDLATQTSSGTPQSRVFGSPFLRPAAAC